MLKDLKLLGGEMVDKLDPTVESKPKGLIAIKGSWSSKFTQTPSQT